VNQGLENRYMYCLACLAADLDAALAKMWKGTGDHDGRITPCQKVRLTVEGC
jgi:hypothetical protein